MPPFSLMLTTWFVREFDQISKEEVMAQGHFGHMVFFKLKDSSPTAVQQLVNGCKAYLSEHPGTVFFDAGTLASTTRDVNDRDFDVALHLVFDSRESHDAYQSASRHDAFIDAFKENWEKVRVFDSEL